MNPSRPARMLLGALLMPPLAGATPAFAADDDQPEYTYVEYTGTVTQVNVRPDGSVNPVQPYDRTMGVECDEVGCHLTGFLTNATTRDEFPMDGAHGEWSFDEGGDVCASSDPDRHFTGAGTLIVDATAESLTFRYDEAGSQPTQCESVTQIFGKVITGTLAYSAGDPCVLDGAACPPEPTATPTATAAVAAPVAASGAREPDEPSVLSELSTPAETLSAGQIALAVGITLVLVILMALPTHLLNTAVEHGTSTIAARLRRGADAARRAPLTGALPAAAGVLLAAVISAFVDPQFGPDLAGLRTLASILTAFAVEVGLGWAVVIAVTRRLEPTSRAEFRFVPATLLVVIGAVVFTRTTGFEPGIVFGLVAGVGFGSALAAAAKARVALVGAGYSFVIAVVSWLVYAALPSDLVFVRETLAGITIAGIAALPVALIPLRGLSGFDVWTWNRAVWIVSYAVGLVGFFLVLMPMPFAWGGVRASLAVWIALFVAYAAVATLTWLAVVRPWRRETA